MLPSFVRPTLMSDRLYEYVLSVGLREPDAFRGAYAKTPRDCQNANGRLRRSKAHCSRCWSNSSAQRSALRSARSPVIPPRGSLDDRFASSPPVVWTFV